MLLLTLTSLATRQPTTVNLDLLIEMYALVGMPGTELRFAMSGDEGLHRAYTVTVIEDYDTIIDLINTRVAPVINAPSAFARPAASSSDPLAGWLPVEMSDELVAEMCAAEADDAAAEARMDAWLGHRHIGGKEVRDIGKQQTGDGQRASGGRTDRPVDRTGQVRARLPRGGEIAAAGRRAEDSHAQRGQ